MSFTIRTKTIAEVVVNIIFETQRDTSLAFNRFSSFIKIFSLAVSLTYKRLLLVTIYIYP